MFSFNLEARHENDTSVTDTIITGISRCLFVDENEHNRTILSPMLTAWGLSCNESDNGLGSLKLIESDGPYDLIIMDNNMPYLDGIETVRVIHEKLRIPLS